MAGVKITLNCRHCKKDFLIERHRLNRRGGSGVMYCSRACYYASQIKPFNVTQFWTRVRKTEKCWLWEGGKHGDGYGCCQKYQGSRRAHYVSYCLAYGPIKRTLDVLHKCDTPLCVRPDHLFLGTQQDNQADMMAKGRYSHGESRYNAVLTADDVRSIRSRFAAGGITHQGLALKYRITRFQIGAIIRGTSWKHVK